MAQLRVLVVSLDRLSRAGLAAVLDQQPGLTVEGQATGDEDALLPLDVYAPDVIVWDVSWETASATSNLGLLRKHASRAGVDRHGEPGSPGPCRGRPRLPAP